MEFNISESSRLSSLFISYYSGWADFTDLTEEAGNRISSGVVWETTDEEGWGFDVSISLRGTTERRSTVTESSFLSEATSVIEIFLLGFLKVRDLPRCSLPLSSTALLNEDFFENLTKAVPFDLPSSLVKSLTSVTFPHSLKKSLISLS